MSTSTFTNIERLKEWFSNFDSVLIAFSSGVDSSLLAHSAYATLGKNAIAVTSISPSFSKQEIQFSRLIAKEIGIELIEVKQDDLEDKGYVENMVNRCYFCRSNLVRALAPVALARKIEVCVDGTHVDDMASPRPGVKALREARFRAPYVELGIGKEEIRQMARALGLSNSEKPSEACLSSRIAYGQKISTETLNRIEDSETFIRALTGATIIRVRTIGERAIVELDKEHVEAAIENTERIKSKLIEMGYSSVEIDPNGYKSGRMLELFLNDLV